MSPSAHPALTIGGNGAGNWPLLHFVITRSSVTIVARRSHTCWPILTARLETTIEGDGEGADSARQPKVASSVDLPRIVNVLIQFAHGGQGAQEDEGEAQDDDGVFRLHPEEALSDKAVSLKAARLGCR